jgi:ribosome-binding protein aMBF1 (putative translation factor)
MRKVEAIGVREGLTKRALAAEIGTNKDALHNWLSGRALGRRETVEKLQAFLKTREIAKVSGTARR